MIKLINKFNNFTFIKFFIIGGFSGFLDLILLYIFTEFMGIWYFYSGIFSFLFVSIIGYLLNKKITFKNTDNNLTVQYIKYTFGILIGMAINNLFLFIFTNIFGVWYILSRVFSSLIALIWNYSFSKKVIFLDKNN